jgi:L-fuculose-phosphate aldolase
VSKEAIKTQIVKTCQWLHHKNMLAAADGNVSYRISDQEILITPTGMHKGFINETDIATITIDNKIISGTPSGERLMHLEIYKNCPKAKAVVHAHPPTAIAWTVARPDLEELPGDSLSEVILAVGRIPIAKYALPGTLQMGENLKPFLPDYRVMILARHGALSWGEDLPEAYNGIEHLEHSALILKNAVELGGLISLSSSELESLKELRKKLGERSL